MSVKGDYYIAGNGDIHVVVAMDLAPFFIPEIENKFTQIRSSNIIPENVVEEIYRNTQPKESSDKYIYRGKSRRAIQHSKEQRLLENKGYSLGIFRGLIMNDFFTHVFKININKYKKYIMYLLKNRNFKEKTTPVVIKGKEIEFKYPNIYQHVLRLILYYLEKQHVQTIEVKISKSGIGYIFIKRRIKLRTEVKTGEYIDSIERCIEVTNNLLDSPIDNRRITREINARLNRLIKKNNLKGINEKVRKKIVVDLVERFRDEKEHTVFTSYLWGFALQSMHYFLEKENVGTFLANALNKKGHTIAPNQYGAYIKDLILISYSVDSGVVDAKPIHNYHFSYHLPNLIKRRLTGERIENAFNCPSQIEQCETKKNDKSKCMLYQVGDKIFTLMEGALVYNKDEKIKKKIKHSKNQMGKPSILEKELFSNTKNNVASWSSEICLIESEKTFVLNSPGAIAIDGSYLKYNEYWTIIIKGIQFIIGLKTLLQVIHRSLIQIAASINEMEELKKKEDEKKKSLLVELFKSIFRKKQESEVSLSKVSQETYNVSTLINRARIVLNPNIVSRAKFAQKKIEKMMHETGASRLFEHIDKSFNEINNEINNFNSREIAAKQSETMVITGVIAAIAAMATIFLAVIKPIYGNWETIITWIKDLLCKYNLI